MGLVWFLAAYSAVGAMYYLATTQVNLAEELPGILVFVLLGIIPLIISYGLLKLKKWAYYLFTIYFFVLVLLFLLFSHMYPDPDNAVTIKFAARILVIVFTWLALFVPLFVRRKKFH